MKMKLMFVSILTAGALYVSGCAMQPGGVAPSNIPLDGRSYTVIGTADTTDSRVYLLGLLPITGANTTRDAIDEAIRSRRGDAMINITVESYSQFWILFTRFVTRVEGDVIRFDGGSRK